MLSKIINENLIRLNISANDWEDAVRKAASALLENNKISAPYIDEMINKRNLAKKAGNYLEADQIREELLSKGIVIKDTREGTIFELNK
jgi:cysteinyl-tRNA synthetase